MPDLRHLICWQVYPLGAMGAPIRDEHGDPQPRLERLLPWLDYVVELGCNGLLLGPVFASATHGYDTTDHYRVDPRLGDDATLDALVAGCAERGIAVLLDGVFNHVSDQHPLFRRALEEGPDGDAAACFEIDLSGSEPTWRDFEGHHELVALRHDAPQVQQLVADVMCHWLDRGIGGWRLDAAYAISPQQWRPIVERVRERHPDAVLLGEVLHGDYAAFVRDSGIDTVTQYELWKAIWSSIADRNLFELAHALERHDALLSTFCPQTFVGNHDVTRIAERVGDDGAALALVVLMTVGGAPSVYYGDEQAFRGVKEDRLGGDDAVRPPLPGAPNELSPQGCWMLEVHQQLIGLRRRHAWLAGARTDVGELTNTRMVYTATDPEDGERLTVLLDLGGEPAAVPVARVIVDDEVVWEYRGR